MKRPLGVLAASVFLALQGLVGVVLAGLILFQDPFSIPRLAEIFREAGVSSGDPVIRFLGLLMAVFGLANLAGAGWVFYLRPKAKLVGTVLTLLAFLGFGFIGGLAG